MKRKCDKCGRQATHHSVEVHKGQKVQKNLCDGCAAEEGESIQGVNTPINELLSNFVKLHAGAESEPVGGGGHGRPSAARKELKCDQCGMSFDDFREHSLLGCPQCYKAFEGNLASLLERAHEGATHHVGKVPNRAGAGEARQVQLTRMRKRLDDAVASEDFELAAQLRDEIGQLEDPAR